MSTQLSPIRSTVASKRLPKSSSSPQLNQIMGQLPSQTNPQKPVALFPSASFASTNSGDRSPKTDSPLSRTSLNSDTADTADTADSADSSYSSSSKKEEVSEVEEDNRSQHSNDDSDDFADSGLNDALNSDDDEYEIDEAQSRRMRVPEFSFCSSRVSFTKYEKCLRDPLSGFSFNLQKHNWRSHGDYGLFVSLITPQECESLPDSVFSMFRVIISLKAYLFAFDAEESSDDSSRSHSSTLQQDMKTRKLEILEGVKAIHCNINNQLTLPISIDSLPAQTAVKTFLVHHFKKALGLSVDSESSNWVSTGLYEGFSFYAKHTNRWGWRFYFTKSIKVILSYLDYVDASYSCYIDPSKTIIANLVKK